MRISLSGSRPIVYRSLFMLYSAITEPSRLKTNLAMCFSLYRVSAEPTQNSVEHLSASRERIDDVRHDHGYVVPASIVVGQLNQLADRKSTRLNSSHQIISYAVFCL